MEASTMIVKNCVNQAGHHKSHTELSRTAQEPYGIVQRRLGWHGDNWVAQGQSGQQRLAKGHAGPIRP